MVMANYYYRKPIHLWKTTTSPAQSIVLDAVKEDRLWTFDDISNLVLSNKDNELVTYRDEIKTILEQLIGQDFIGEANGFKLEKWLKTLG